MAIIGQIPATKMCGYNYSINIKNTDQVIELKDNFTIMENIKIISHSRGNNVYTVLSHLNDKELRELIMSEYNLKLNQVIITSLQNSGPLGAM
ncbi:hypothetical protein ACG3JJ_03900 [Streptococcus parauberis]|uniref:Uncharacterized protein n=2 Tax=Streptococcus parauberis TaxID=1348 RepID=A0A0E2UCR6_9STRE|nr:hypothetical protein [Streptococcus parauberis]AEF24640.1 exported protein [Streptococcus parauberis KCTC 11537]AUT06767.1 hypothetical protein SPSF3K_02059 [Streptococcus parauberis]EMG25318.1 hypothetical protein SPJ1_0729 [Streptococcus parauberis KRS-02083]KYP17879.1 hypothetical protein AKL14_01335 [Streptococcus parauberis]KYP19252.1 hypothetical protein TN39_01452 [Streptococcus parauberis]